MSEQQIAAEQFAGLTVQRVKVAGTFAYEAYAVVPDDADHDDLTRRLSDEIADAVRVHSGWLLDTEEGDFTIVVADSNQAPGMIDVYVEPTFEVVAGSVDLVTVLRAAEGMTAEKS